MTFFISIIFLSFVKKVFINYFEPVKFIYPLLLLILQFPTLSQRLRPSDYISWEDKNGTVPVRVNYVIIQRDDSTANFPNNDVTNRFFKNVTDSINYIYSNLKHTEDLACYKGSLPFDTTLNVQFKYKLMFIQNSNYWDNQGIKYGFFCPQEKNWWLSSLDDSICNNTTIPRAINIYFTEDGDHYNRLFEKKTDSTLNASRGACSEYPNHKKWTKSSRLHYPNEYSSYLYQRNNASPGSSLGWKKWGLAKGLAHELGHSLGLGHNNEHHGRNQCWHSIMHQAGDSPRDYLQPSEIAKVNYKLTHTSLTSFIDTNYFEESPFIIDSSLLITDKTRLFQSITVEEGSKLTLSDTLFIPNNAFLLIKKNGALIFLNQGVILHLNRSKVLIKRERKVKISAEDKKRYLIKKQSRCWFRRS